MAPVDHLRAGDSGCRLAAPVSTSFAQRRTRSVIGTYGDEFLVLLAGMDARGVAEAAERLRAAVEGTAIDVGAGAVSVTISVGVAWVDPGPGNDRSDLATLIERADSALYAAKRAGRNCSTVA